MVQGAPVRSPGRCRIVDRNDRDGVARSDYYYLNDDLRGNRRLYLHIRVQAQSARNAGPRYSHASSRVAMVRLFDPTIRLSILQMAQSTMSLVALARWCQENVPDGRISMCRVEQVCTPCSRLCCECLIVEKRAKQALADAIQNEAKAEGCSKATRPTLPQ